MFWKKRWDQEAVLALLGGILAASIFGSLTLGLLRHAGVRGFRSDVSMGSVLLATLSFHGAALLLGAAFLKFHEINWRQVFGDTGWKRCLALALKVLVVVTPLGLGLKAASEFLLQRLHWAVEEQSAVELVRDAGPWVRIYLIFSAIILIPLAEEFIFRGLLFSFAKQLGWPKLGWFGVSFLFALMHANAPIFLPLFVLALALTWLYERTEGLLAPVMAHSLFNCVNVVILILQEPPNRWLPQHP
jgi:membrane protease YdiL (CAAX protease family)